MGLSNVNILAPDLLAHLDSWPDIELMLKHIKLCVFLRNNQDKKNVTEQLHRLQAKFPDLEYTLLPEVWTEVSSSRIRDEIKRTGQSEDVEPAVLDYIKQKSIY